MILEYLQWRNFEKVILNNAKSLLTGVYYVGEDLEAGKYDMLWVSGRGNLFARTKNSPNVNEIFGTDERYGHIKEYKGH